jgi:cell division transport system ATP-binding protein
MSRNPRHPVQSPGDDDARQSADPVLRFAGVGMRYGRGPETLREVSFELQPGSFHFLTGPSGAGKSSLLKLIYRAEKPSRGLITLFGQDLSVLPAKGLPLLRRRIGVVFQEFRLLEHLSAFDNVALPLRLAGKKAKAYKADVAELLAWVGLGSKLHAMPATLSGGEKQRLAIARAVIAQPDILLADEPTGNVDHEMAARILRLFVELNRQGSTVLIASHDRELVARAGMPVLELQDGRLTPRSAA